MVAGRAVFDKETRRKPLVLASDAYGDGIAFWHLVMRRTRSSLPKDNHADPKVVADQLGHSSDVNLKVYTQTALSLRKQAVNALESTLEQTSNPQDVLRVM